MSNESTVAPSPEIPITVLGGYLGAGKTTLLNSLLRRAAGRRIGVVVNDFGELGVDVQLIGDVDGVPVMNLVNGCVCCTLGDDLRATLNTLAALEPPLDHIVIEASGVADPANTAAWGTVPPFVPGGVVVLAAANSVRRQASDRYVGTEVRRQLEGADLILVTKIDQCSAADVDEVRGWLGTVSSAPSVEAAFGDVAIEVVLEPEPVDRVSAPHANDHDSTLYSRWEYQWAEPIGPERLDGFLAELPSGLLRMKGLVRVGDPGTNEVRVVLVQVVGATVHTTVRESISSRGEPTRSALSAIGAAPFDVATLERRALHYLG